jgi:hypothetical protein
MMTSRPLEIDEELSLMRPNLKSTPLDPDREVVHGLWMSLAVRYRTQLIPKKVAMEMVLLDKIASRFGFADGASFLESYATTLGRRIYVPFGIGIPDPEWPLWSQIGTALHEHQHVVQMVRAGGLPAYARDYLLSSAKRASLEADAYACNLFVTYQRYGEVPDTAIDWVIRSLEDAYYVTTKDLSVVRAMLKSYAAAIESGGVPNEVCKIATIWMQKNAPHLWKTRVELRSEEP